MVANSSCTMLFAVAFTRRSTRLQQRRAFSHAFGSVSLLFTGRARWDLGAPVVAASSLFGAPKRDRRFEGAPFVRRPTVRSGLTAHEIGDQQDRTETKAVTIGASVFVVQ